MHIQNSDIVTRVYSSIVKDIEAYTDILMLIQPLTGAKLGGEGRPPLPFLKTEKSVLILERMILIVSIYWLNFPFNMYFQLEKNFQTVSLRGLFLRSNEMFIEVPQFHKPSLSPEKFLVAHQHSDIILFAKRSKLNV